MPRRAPATQLTASNGTVLQPRTSTSHVHPSAHSANAHGQATASASAQVQAGNASASASTAADPAVSEPSAAAAVAALKAQAGSITAATSKASGQDKRQQTAKAYLGKLQAGLPAAAYQQLMKCLQQYRKDHDTLRVTDGVLEVLRLPGRRHLLLDFATFLRAQDRDWFCRCIK